MFGRRGGDEHQRHRRDDGVGGHPAHAAGVVDVAVTTPDGFGVLKNGFTFVAPAVGLPTGGGVIAALGGGLSNLIASTADNGTSVVWGGNVTVGSQSTTDGAANTALILATLGAGGAAASLCSSYEVDSSGNTPCQAGNACYDDWFLPAQTQLGNLYDNRVAIGGFDDNSYYWSSTESPLNAALDAVNFSFNLGMFTYIPKYANVRVPVSPPASSMTRPGTGLEEACARSRWPIPPSRQDMARGTLLAACAGPANRQKRVLQTACGSKARRKLLSKPRREKRCGGRAGMMRAGHSSRRPQLPQQL